MATTTPAVETDEDKTYVSCRELGRSNTHDRSPDGHKTCLVTCEDTWSMMQMRALDLLSQNNKFLQSILPRSKRIAGNYAALFLSDEGTAVQGRFYWAGLAGFAGKQVTYGIDYADQSMDSFIGQVRAMAGLSLYYLVKGNLWIFTDVAPTLLYYQSYGADSFFHCVDRRNASTYTPKAKEMMEAVPWAKGENTDLKQAIEKRFSSLNLRDLSWSKLTLQDNNGTLSETNNCKVSPFLKNGFQSVQEYEKNTDKEGAKAKSSAFNSAWQFLLHEQTVNAQAMFYDHPDFQYAWDNNDLGRKINNAGHKVFPWWTLTGAQDPNLVFNAKPDVTEDDEKNLNRYGLDKQEVSVRMDIAEGKLYDVTARMKYVKRILTQYHKLMQGPSRAYMIEQLNIISGWKSAT